MPNDSVPSSIQAARARDRRRVHFEIRRGLRLLHHREGLRPAWPLQHGSDPVEPCSQGLGSDRLAGVYCAAPPRSSHHERRTHGPRPLNPWRAQVYKLLCGKKTHIPPAQLQERAPERLRRFRPAAAAVPYCSALAVGVACTVLIALVRSPRRRSSTRRKQVDGAFCTGY